MNKGFVGVYVKDLLISRSFSGVQRVKRNCGVERVKSYSGVGRVKADLVDSALVEPDSLCLLAEDLHQNLVGPPQTDVGLTEPSFLQVLLELSALDHMPLLQDWEWVDGGGVQLAQRDAWRGKGERGRGGERLEGRRFC